MKKILLMVGLMVTVSGCSVDKMVGEAIEKNPDLVFKAIEKNPDKFMQVVQAAARKARPGQNAGQDVAKQQEEEFKNPKVPEVTPERVLGSADAPITLVEYTDLECPFCARGAQVVKELKKLYGPKLKVVVKHLPLPMHPKAMPAAHYYEAVAMSHSLAKAHEWMDEVFANQSSMRSGDVNKFFDSMAKKVGVNASKVKQTLSKEKDKIEATVRSDMMEAQKFGFQGTPGFLVNGVSVRGAYPVEAFRGLIERHLAQGQAQLAPAPGPTPVENK